jgi:hypothetical protein
MMAAANRIYIALCFPVGWECLKLREMDERHKWKGERGVLWRMDGRPAASATGETAEPHHCLAPQTRSVLDLVRTDLRTSTREGEEYKQAWKDHSYFTKPLQTDFSSSKDA